MAADTLVRYVTGFAFLRFVDPMYENLGVEWATSLLGFSSIVLMLIPWCFWIW
jgi:DHA1 family multidrug resistance protein-like MFS transporter